MENNEIKAEETATTQEVETKTENEEIKTFTQEEVNEIVAKEKARARKGTLSKEEMEAFKEWQESKKTEAEKQAERDKEYQKTQSEKEYLAQENYLLKHGIKSEDTDYIIYKVSKLEGNFEDNISDFLDNNPRFKETGKATGIISKGNKEQEEETGVRAILRARHPEMK